MLEDDKYYGEKKAEQSKDHQGCKWYNFKCVSGEN